MNVENARAELKKIGMGAMDSIRGMVEALECDYERLEELREEKSAAEFPEDNSELNDLQMAAGECTDRDDAEKRIQDEAISVEYRSGWSTSPNDMVPEEFCILLTIGRPGVRIIGDLNEDGEATSACLEVQDWGTRWTEHIVNCDDYDAIMSYCRCHYLGN